MTAKFITFEGGEGSGKSTHLKRMADHLIYHGYRVHTTFDPGDTDIGNALRPLMLDKKYDISREAEFLLYLAARAELVNKVIIPKMEDNDFILCDRFYDSTAVYQGVIRGWDNIIDVDNETFLDFMHRLFSHNIKPDATFLFDVNPVLGLNRSLGEEKDESRWEEEGIAIHTKINNAFLDLADILGRNFIVIDANMEMNDVFSELAVKFYENILCKKTWRKNVG